MQSKQNYSLLKKFKFTQEEVSFVGHILNSKGIQADSQKIKVIAHFPELKNLTGLHSFTGLVNQLDELSSKLSKKL